MAADVNFALSSQVEAYKALEAFSIKLPRVENTKIKGIMTSAKLWEPGSQVELSITELNSYVNRIIHFFKANPNSQEIGNLKQSIKTAIEGLKFIKAIASKNSSTKSTSHILNKKISEAIALLARFDDEIDRLKPKPKQSLITAFTVTIQNTSKHIDSATNSFLHKLYGWTYTIAEMDDLVTNLVKSNRSQQFRDEAAQLFNENYPIAEKLARDLNETFCRKYNIKGVKSYNCRTGEITVSAEQLRGALTLARTNFSHLLNLASTPEQRIKASRLIQMIIFNESIDSIPLPKTPNCFQITNYLNDTIEDVLEEHRSFLYHALEKSFDGNTMQEKLLNTSGQFCADAVERGTNVVLHRFPSLETEEKKEVDIEMLLRYDNAAPFAFDLIHRYYVDYLIQNPLEIEKIILGNLTSDFYQLCRELTPQDQQSVEFSKDIFYKFMEDPLKKWAPPQVSFSEEQVRENPTNNEIFGWLVFDKLAKIMDASSLSHDELSDIKKALSSIKSEIGVEFIESLMRVKFLEIITFLNQSSYARPLEEIKNFWKKCNLLQKGEESLSFAEKGANATFTFSSPSFDRFISSVNFNIWTTERDFFADEGVLELFDDSLTCFVIQTDYEVASFNRVSEVRPNPKLIMNFKFSYQVPFTVIDNLQAYAKHLGREAPV